MKKCKIIINRKSNFNFLHHKVKIKGQNVRTFRNLILPLYANVHKWTLQTTRACYQILWNKLFPLERGEMEV